MCWVALFLAWAAVAGADEGAVKGAQAGRDAGTALSGAAAASKLRPVTYAVVEQPRLTGYFVGDLLTQRVLLQHDGQAFTPATLPSAGRVSAWFERRRVAITTDEAMRRWLVIEYQILNAPPKLTDVTLPAWQLAIRAGGGVPPMTLTVPSVSINVAPLSPPGSPEQVGTRDLRPDRLPPVIPTAPIRRAIELSAGALALTVVAWIGWMVWRNRRAIDTQPFARALRELGALDDREPRAWQVLHRAFDRTAGRVIQSATLPVLFERAPQLVPVRARIEDFYAQSSLLFFGSATTGGGRTSSKGANASPDLDEASGPRSPSGAPSIAITSAAERGTPAKTAAAGLASAVPLPRALCAELRRIERRHER